MPKPKAPGWTARGEIPDADPQSARDEQLDLFDEDMLQMVDPTGTYTIDIGWYPAAARDGRFICRLIRSNDWDRPFVQIETSNRKAVWKWLRQQIDDVITRVGHVGTFAPNVGFFIYQKTAKRVHSKKKHAPRQPKVVPTYIRLIQKLAHNIMPPAISGERHVPTATIRSTVSEMAIGLGAGMPLEYAT